MAILKIYQDQELKKTFAENQEIKTELAKVGIGFSTWQAAQKLNKENSQEEIKTLFANEIQQVLTENNFSNFDIVSVSPKLEGIELLKEKFIPEHTHDDNEVRFFIDGSGLFCVNYNDSIYQILCQKGDYISVPAKTKHWFDMGSAANFKCIRFFENESGWVAKYTGSKISTQYPLMDEF